MIEEELSLGREKITNAPTAKSRDSSNHFSSFYFSQKRNKFARAKLYPKFEAVEKVECWGGSDTTLGRRIGSNKNAPLPHWFKIQCLAQPNVLSVFSGSIAMEVGGLQKLRFSPYLSSSPTFDRSGRRLPQTCSIHWMSNGPQVHVKQTRALSIPWKTFMCPG